MYCQVLSRRYCDAGTCRRYCQVCHAGIGDFLDADFDDLTSVLSITVDYLAGPPPHVDRRPCCVFIAAARGLECARCPACLACLAPRRPSPRVNGARDRRVVVGSRWGFAPLYTLSICTAARCL